MEARSTHRLFILGFIFMLLSWTSLCLFFDFSDTIVNPTSHHYTSPEQATPSYQYKPVLFRLHSIFTKHGTALIAVVFLALLFAFVPLHTRTNMVFSEPPSDHTNVDTDIESPEQIDPSSPAILEDNHSDGIVVQAPEDGEEYSQMHLYSLLIFIPIILVAVLVLLGGFFKEQFAISGTLSIENVPKGVDSQTPTYPEEQLELARSVINVLPKLDKLNRKYHGLVVSSILSVLDHKSRFLVIVKALREATLIHTIEFNTLSHVDSAQLTKLVKEIFGVDSWQDLTVEAVNTRFKKSVDVGKLDDLSALLLLLMKSDLRARLIVEQWMGMRAQYSDKDIQAQYEKLVLQLCHDFPIDSLRALLSLQ